MKEELIYKIILNTEPYQGMEDDLIGLYDLSIIELKKILENM